MLQNRVDPFGNLIKTEARGKWMGNRGNIHSPNKEIQNPFKLKAWLTCLLHFKERKREVMSPGQYTELFFLDEATAFSAGHRPCFECRRKDFNKFKESWIKANPEYGFIMKTPISNIDEILHRERIKKDFSKATFIEENKNLPEGIFVSYNDQAYLIKKNCMHLWSPSGYEKGIPLPKENTVTVLTPLSVFKTFKAGYKPQMDI